MTAGGAVRLPYPPTPKDNPPRMLTGAGFVLSWGGHFPMNDCVLIHPRVGGELSKRPAYHRDIPALAGKRACEPCFVDHRPLKGPLRCNEARPERRDRGSQAAGA